jgi:hypothetical protein
MSLYYTIAGGIQYERQEDFDAAVRLLEDGLWLKDDHFISDTDEQVTEDAPNLDRENWMIQIPMFVYCKLGNVLNDLFRLGGKGRVVWTCTDGFFEGGVIVDGEETVYNLEQWSEENMPESDQPDTEAEEYCQWQEEVESRFLEKYSAAE